MPQVVALDLKLPFVSGLEVPRQIKADSHTQSIAVVALTSLREERDIIDPTPSDIVRPPE